MEPETRSILLVDDDDFQLELLAGQLADIGWHHVDRATSGAQALAQFSQHGANIAAIISDLSMPDMDGLALMRHLMAAGFKGGVILISGLQVDILSSAHGLAQAHGMHILGCLHKPVDPAHMQLLLASLRAPYSGANPTRIARALDAACLEAALAAGEFMPWYQPKVDIQVGSTIGVEALARWPQADGSLISPGVFIPAIEAAGLADQLFFAMARQVAADMTLWRSQGVCIKAAINLSMDTALNLAMPEQLRQIVASAGLCPADFVVEVTESQLMFDRSLAMETLTRLSLMGFTLSIDDFGTGYSSLVQLIDLPFGELKIDGSFVRRASHEHKAQSVLKIAILLGHSLGMQVTAEGVETAEQLEFVRANGGQVVQGYHFAKPMAWAGCTDWLVQHGNLDASTNMPLAPSDPAQDAI